MILSFKKTPLLALLLIVQASFASNLTISSTSYNSSTFFSSVTDGDTVFVAAQLRTDGGGTCDNVIDFSDRDVVIIIQNGGDIRLFSQCWLVITDKSQLVINSGGALTNTINNRGIIVVNEAGDTGVICASGSGNPPTTASYPSASCISAISNINNIGQATSLLSFGQVVSNGGLLGSTVLPVRWLDFNAEVKENCVKLSWSTASELNCSHFVVERSVDGNQWEDLGEVRGHGTHQGILHYTFNDLLPLVYAYYRVVQYDYDANLNISPGIAVNFGQGSGKLNIYPNPSSGTVNIRGHSESEIVRIEIYGNSGQEMVFSNLAAPGRESYTLILDPGMYMIVVLDSENQRYVERLVVW